MTLKIAKPPANCGMCGKPKTPIPTSSGVIYICIRCDRGHL